jgi:tetratricopeptide (TPR) repeat protein
MLEDLLARSRHLEPVVLAKVKNDLAVAYMKAENWPQAERVGREAYALRVERLGERDPASVQTLVNLGANAIRLGEYQTARQRLSRAVELARTLGPDGARTATHALSYLGLALGLLGDAAGSAAACEEAARQASRFLDPDHPVYLKLSLVWAEAALERAEWDRAIELAQDVAARAAKSLGENPDMAALRQRAESISASARSRRRIDPP